jgi:hypothetical protein
MVGGWRKALLELRLGGATLVRLPGFSQGWKADVSSNRFRLERSDGQFSFRTGFDAPTVVEPEGFNPLSVDEVVMLSETPGGVTDVVADGVL